MAAQLYARRDAVGQGASASQVFLSLSLFLFFSLSLFLSFSLQILDSVSFSNLRTLPLVRLSYFPLPEVPLSLYCSKIALFQEVIRSLHSVTEVSSRQTRRFPRISLPKGMQVSWHGEDLQLSSRVRTLSMGGLFISTQDPPPVGTKVRLTFEVPGGNVRAEAIVRTAVPGEGLGVEFTRMDLRDRLLLQRLLNRLLR
jgi:hypothetical protein